MHFVIATVNSQRPETVCHILLAIAIVIVTMSNSSISSSPSSSSAARKGLIHLARHRHNQHQRPEKSLTHPFVVANVTVSGQKRSVTSCLPWPPSASAARKKCNFIMIRVGGHES